VPLSRTQVLRMVDGVLERAGFLPPVHVLNPVFFGGEEGLLLPSYPGEMGVEIRHFLGRVEPWLRAGWRVLARRPEFYPEGTAVFDAAFFALEDRLFEAYGADRLAQGPHLRHPQKSCLSVLGRRLARRKATRLQAEWRAFVGARTHLAERCLWTRWDEDLSLVSTEFLSAAPWAFSDVVPPSYLPPAYTDAQSPHQYQDHVGVQFRSVVTSLDPRNSQVDDVLRDAVDIGEHLSLPILVYGRSDGTVLPDGYVNTSSLRGGHLLERELGYLRSCKVMLAPNSGWADLMCWLRVPTLLENRGNTRVFGPMAAFAPRLLVRSQEDTAASQADALLGGASAFRDMGSEISDAGSIQEWVHGV
jgi:hypothetical protein